jgi:hypothetical protein
VCKALLNGMSMRQTNGGWINQQTNPETNSTTPKASAPARAKISFSGNERRVKNGDPQQQKKQPAQIGTAK